MRRAFLLPAVLLLPMTLGSGSPAAEKKPVTDTYFATAVEDDYRWLEDWNDPGVRAWSEAQSVQARAVLDRLPHLAEIRKRVEQIANFRSPGYGVPDAARSNPLCNQE